MTANANLTPPDLRLDLGKIRREIGEALEMHRRGRLDEAARGYRRILQAWPTSFDALHLLGVVEAQRGQGESAVEYFGRALSIDPQHAVAQSNLGNALRGLGRLDDALVCYAQSLANDPTNLDVRCNRAVTLADLGRRDEAIAAFDQVLSLEPWHAQAQLGRSAALAATGRLTEALRACDDLLEQQPRWPAALNNRADALRVAGRHAEAVHAYDDLLQVAPDFDHAAGHQWLSRLSLCDWSDHAASVDRLLARVRQGRRCVPPGLALCITDSAALQLQAARTFGGDPGASPRQRPRRARCTARDRLRVAYLSADFGNHPVSLLMAGVFEQHDRSRFEPIAISFRPADGSEIGRRVEAAFDRFIDVSRMSDAEVCAQLDAMGVDIAVDLMGHTSGCRPGIFARQVVPVTVAYLGYPGSTGSRHIDYLIADHQVVPDAQRRHFSEQVVRLPEVFQANDDQRRASETAPPREALGLPGHGLVYGCFNNVLKYNPPMFDVWMRLLARTPGSVLWLYADDELVRTHLRDEAVRRGIAPERLVFAARVPYEDHLARLARADLFLDTFPFNAGTTASDALWAGVPLVTLAGEAFASRMAASLLHSVGLPELVTQGIGDYEALALALATNGYARETIRERLRHARRHSTLFATRRLCRHLEAAFETMCEFDARGAAPEAFDVPLQPA